MPNDHREKAVEAAAEAIHDEREYRDPTGPAPDDWYPPGDNPGQDPPREPALWAPMVEAGEYPATQEEIRAEARSALAAADPHLRRAHFEEFREGLLAAMVTARQGAVVVGDAGEYVNHGDLLGDDPDARERAFAKGTVVQVVALDDFNAALDQAQELLDGEDE